MTQYKILRPKAKTDGLVVCEVLVFLDGADTSVNSNCIGRFTQTLDAAEIEAAFALPSSERDVVMMAMFGGPQTTNGIVASETGCALMMGAYTFPMVIQIE